MLFCVWLSTAQHHLKLVSSNNLAEISVPVAVLAAPTDGIDKYEDLLASRTEVRDSISCNLIGKFITCESGFGLLILLRACDNTGGVQIHYLAESIHINIISASLWVIISLIHRRLWYNQFALYIMFSIKQCCLWICVLVVAAEELRQDFSRCPAWLVCEIWRERCAGSGES